MERPGPGRRREPRGAGADRPGARRLGRAEPPPLPAAQRAVSARCTLPRGPVRRRSRIRPTARRPVRGHRGGARRARRAASPGGAGGAGARRRLLRRDAARPMPSPAAGRRSRAILDGQDRAVGSFKVPSPPSTGTPSSPAPPARASRRPSGTCWSSSPARASRGWPSSRPSPSTPRWAAGSSTRAGDRDQPFRPGDACRFGVNPLAPEPGYPVQAHIDMVRALFHGGVRRRGAVPADHVAGAAAGLRGQRLGRGHRRGRPGAPFGPPYPTLEQLQNAALDVIEDVGYGKELMADVEGFVDVRLRSLRIGSAGRFFEGGHPADIGGLLRATSSSPSRTSPTTRTRRSSWAR